MKNLLIPILWIRQYIFFIYLAVFGLILSSLNGILKIIGAPFGIRFQVGKTWSVVLRVGIFVILQIKTKQLGRENLEKTPCVYICKHQSSWETMTFISLIPKSCFVLKKELTKIPIFGWSLSAMDSIPVDRSQGVKSLKEVIRQGKERLSRGLGIIIFPEGTRVKPGKNPKFHKSAITLAKSNNATIIPVAHNAGSVWPIKGLIKPGVITISYGEPLESKGMNMQELTDTCHTWMQKQMERLENK